MNLHWRFSIKIFITKADSSYKKMDTSFNSGGIKHEIYTYYYNDFSV